MESFEKFIEDFRDEIIDSISVSEEVISQSEGKIPDEIISIWREHGFAGYEEGRFWLINPLEYKDFVNKVVDIDREVWPIARTAFADFVIVYDDNDSEELRFDVVNLRHQIVTNVTIGVDKFISMYLMEPVMIETTAKTKFYYDALDNLGELKVDQCYGFEPLLALGGDEKPGNIKIFNLAAHLELLAQALEEPIEY